MSETTSEPAPDFGTRLKLKTWLALSIFAASPAFASSDARSDLNSSAIDPSEWLRVHRLQAASDLPGAAARIRDIREFPAPGSSLEDVTFTPGRAAELAFPVEQVVVTSPELEDAFEDYARHETLRGVPTVVRNTAWIDATFDGSDRPARIRAFLQDARNRWNLRYVVLGGDVEHVPARYIPWGNESIATDFYYACLDGTWNEDGDAIYGEPLASTNLDGFTNDVAVGPNSEVWVATHAGIGHLAATEFTTFDVYDGLPTNDVLAVATAADGSAWFGTNEGVVSRINGVWETHSASTLPGSEVNAIVAHSATDVWVGLNGGLAHFDGTAWTAYTEEDGLAQSFVTSLVSNGSDLWVGSLRGITRISNGSLTTYTQADGLLSDWVLSLAIDASGTLVVGHADNYFTEGGLSFFDGSNWTIDTLASFGGLDVRGLTVMGDEIWCATNQGLLVYGEDVSVFGEESGLLTSELLSVVPASDSTVAVAGPLGIAIGSPHAWNTYTPAEGLPSAVGSADDVDLLPDVALGRIPADTPADVALYLDKLVEYRAGTNVDHVESALLLGEKLSATSDGKDLALSTKSFLPSHVTTTELYESDGTQDVSSVLTEFDRGHGLVVHVGHGSYDAMGVGRGLELVFNSQIDEIDSARRFGFFLVFSCNSGAFDQDCSTENLLFNPNGGSIGSLANTRPAIAAIDAELSEAMLADLYASIEAQPALSFQRSVTNRVVSNFDAFRTANWWRKMVLVRNFQGAPTLSLWRTTPRALVVEHATTMTLAGSELPVTVRDETGAPVANAVVCVSRGYDDYAFGRTDESGVVTFQVRPDEVADLDVQVNAADFLPHSSTIAVTPAPVPHLVFDSASWHTTTTNGVRRLALDVVNRGTAAPTGWDLTLASTDSRITIVDGDSHVRALGTGRHATALFDVLVNDASSGSVALTLTGQGAANFSETLSLELVAPQFALEGFDHSNDVEPRLRNIGLLAAGSIEAEVALLEGNATIGRNVILATSSAAGEFVNFDHGFEISAASNARFELVIREGAVEMLRRSFDLESPSAPSDVEALPLVNGAELTWLASASTDVVGYKVYARRPKGRRNEEWTEELLAADGTRATVAMSAGASADFKIVAIDASGNESADSEIVTVTANLPEIAGWPQKLSSMIGPSALTVADLDSDGAFEVVLGSMWDANAIHVFQSNGAEWTDGDDSDRTNGIFAKADDRIHAMPLAVDLEGDGEFEIFAASLDGKVYGYRAGAAGNVVEALPGWPVDHTAAVRSAPVAADVDGDGILEIITASNQGVIRAIERDGTIVVGWPKTTGAGGFGSTPAIADLDSDGRDDVVFGGSDGFLYAVSGTGVDLPGFPVAVSAAIRSCAVLADANDDGALDVFVTASDGQVFGFDSSGELLPGWPVQTTALGGFPASPALADLDADGSLELIVPAADALHAFHMDGASLAGWPIALEATPTNSPVVADLDGDGSYDVLIGTSDRRVNAFAVDGTQLAGWPFSFSELPKATPYVTDVDGDGDLDVILGADDRYVRILDAAGAATDAPWPGYHGKNGHGVGEIVTPVLTTGTPEFGPTTGVLSADLQAAGPNPFRGDTAFRFAISREEIVTLAIFDVSGRRVATPASGAYFTAGTHTIRWDGRDDSGRRVASGAYFVKLVAGTAVAHTKVVKLQ